MAEETPGNLSGLGGFLVGRGTSNSRRLDQSADRLEKTISKFSDTLERLTGSLGTQASRMNGGTATAQSSAAMGNGGQVTFGGQQSSMAPEPPDPSWSAGRHRASGSASYVGPPGNGGHHRGSGPGWGRAAGRIGLGVGAVGLTAFTAAHYENQVINQTLAAQYGGYRGWQQAYSGMFEHNYTAASGADAAAAAQAQAQISYSTPWSNNYAMQRTALQRTSLFQPAMTQVQAQKGTAALGTTSTFNRMQMLGISTTTMQGGAPVTDPMSIARQILSRVPGANNIRSMEEMNAALGQTGGITLTIDDMVANGFIPPDSRDVVLENIRAILKAKIGGMSYSQLRRDSRLASRAGSEDVRAAARDRLAGVGIAGGLVQEQRDREGAARQTEAGTIDSFTSAVRSSTRVLGDFRGVLNRILEGPIGAVAGYGSGLAGTWTSPIRSVLRSVGLGDGPASQASSQMSYGGAGLGALDVGGTGPANMSSSQASYGGAARAGGGGGAGSTGSSVRASSYNLGPVKPWVARAANVLGPKFGIRTIYGFGQRGNVSDHPKGLALDFMCGTSAGNRLATFAVANHKALNITYVIWRQRIWSINNPRWKRMEDRGSVTANHYDHVHISFLAAPNNADLGGLRGGGGSGAVPSGPLGEGTDRQDNGSSTAMEGGSLAYGAYSEAAALGLGTSGVMAGGSAGGSGSAGPTGGGAGVAQGGRPRQAPRLSGINGGGSVDANKRLGRQMAAAYGWTGKQWQALEQLWTKESGWNHRADNPTSSAYGIPQAMMSIHFGGENSPQAKAWMNDPKAQIKWGLDYIKGRYGSPAKAWNFWQRNNWYEIGEWNVRNDKDAQVHKGEMILPTKVADAVRSELTAPGIRGRGGQGASITFASGAIVVRIEGGSVTESKARKAGSWVVDAILEDQRMKQIAEGV